MAKKPSVTTISSGYASNTQLNNNLTALRDAFDNTLSLDGSSPNAMGADIDLNGNDLLNAGVVNADNVVVDGINLTTQVANAAASASSAAASASAASQYTPAYFDNVTALLADTRSWPTGQILNTREEGFAYEVAAPGASDHHVTTAGGEKLYGISGSLPILGGGTASHSDGVNTLVGSARYFIGNATPSIDDSALLIGRSLTGSYVSGAHAIRDETLISMGGSGLLAYASFDAIPKAINALAYNHVRGFQSRPEYGGSLTIDEVSGFHTQITHSGVGVITAAYGLRVDPILSTAGGFIGTHYGLFVGDLEASGAVGGGFAIFSGATNIASYHGGLFELGTPPKINVAGWTTFGAVLTHDASGNLVTNPNLTVVNGVLDMKNATTSRVVGSASFKLQLDAVGIVETQKPLQMPVYTVATLPSPASAYTYCRAFVSDALAATFNGIVAGGGSNRVPVFCDGTNWRVG